MSSVGYAVFITARRINLADPPGIPVACGSHEYLGMKAAKFKIFRVT